MVENKLKGRAFVLGDNVDTDQILPGYAMSLPEEELKKHVLKGSSIPDFAERVKAGDIIIAGENFGCGSSREQAAVAVKTSGVSAVVARSFARIFRRNCINIGLPVLTCEFDGEIREGDELEIDLENFTLKNLNSGKTCKLHELSETTMETLKAGGLINKVKKILKDRGEIN